MVHQICLLVFQVSGSILLQSCPYCLGRSALLRYVYLRYGLGKLQNEVVGDIAPLYLIDKHTHISQTSDLAQVLSLILKTLCSVTIGLYTIKTLKKLKVVL